MSQSVDTRNTPSDPCYTSEFLVLWFLLSQNPFKPPLLFLHASSWERASAGISLQLWSQRALPQQGDLWIHFQLISLSLLIVTVSEISSSECVVSRGSLDWDLAPGSFCQVFHSLLQHWLNTGKEDHAASADFPRHKSILVLWEILNCLLGCQALLEMVWMSVH